MDLTEFIRLLKGISEKGYISSLRKGSTGIGFTLEKHLGIDENNLTVPDLGQTELKTHRSKSTSMITLFTFDKKVWKFNQKSIIDDYGTIDSKKRKSLYCTVHPYPNRLKLHSKTTSDFFSLYHDNRTKLAEWKISELLFSLKKKLKNLVLVSAECKKERMGKELFWFNNALLLVDVDEEYFLKALKEGTIKLDIRMHLKDTGVVRNHGTGFRIFEKDLPLLYKIKIDLIQPDKNNDGVSKIKTNKTKNKDQELHLEDWLNRN